MWSEGEGECSFRSSADRNASVSVAEEPASGMLDDIHCVQDSICIRSILQPSRPTDFNSFYRPKITESLSQAGLFASPLSYKKDGPLSSDRHDSNDKYSSALNRDIQY